MIVGIGVDEVEVPRMAAVLARTPSTRGRLFTDAEQAYADGSHRQARSDLMQGALAAGCAFGAAGTSLAHAVQYPIGALTHTAHGTGVAAILPYAMSYNRVTATVEMAEVAVALGADRARHTTEELSLIAIREVARLFAAIGIPADLKALGLPEDRIDWTAESAVGKYPVEAVATMDRVAIEVERDPLYEAIIHAQRIDPEATGVDAVSAAARTMAESLNIAAIVSYTASGASALRAARERPPQPIIALTPIPATGRRLAIVWGLHCVLTGDPKDLDDMVAKACRIAYQEGFASPGQRVIISAGVPLGTPGATNMLRIAVVGEEGAVASSGQTMAQGT